MTEKQKAAQTAAEQIDAIIAAFKVNAELKEEAAAPARIDCRAIAQSFTETVVDRLSRLSVILMIDETRFIRRERNDEVGEDDAHELIARLSLVANEVQSIYEAAEHMTDLVAGMA